MCLALSLPEKNKCAFAAADFALCQKKLILAEGHPDWTTDEVNQFAQENQNHPFAVAKSRTPTRNLPFTCFISIVQSV